MSLPSGPIDVTLSRKSHLASIFVVLLFLVHPLVISSQTYYNITSTKLYFYIAVVSATALCFLILQIISFLKHRQRFFLSPMRPYECALLAYWLVLFASSLFSEYPKYAFFGSSNRNEGFLIMTAYLFSVFFVGRFYRPKERDLLLLCLASALVSGYGICQYYGLDFLHLNPEALSGVIGPNMVYISTMSNRNLLSTYLCLAFSVCLVMFSQKSLVSGWVYLSLGLIVFYMLVLGQSESGYVGLFLAIAALFPFISKTTREAGRLLVFLTGCILCILLTLKLHFTNWPPSVWASLQPYLLAISVVSGVLGAVLWVIPQTSLEKKIFRICYYLFLLIVLISIILLIPKLATISDHKAIQAANEILQGNFDDRLGSDRMFVWKRSLTMIPERLWLGHGPDNFYISFTLRFGAEAVEKLFARYDKMHNEYLQTLFDSGLLGLASLLSFYSLSLWRIRHNIKSPLVLAVFLALVCFIGQAFFNFSSPFAHPLVWAMWGICANMGKISEKTT